MSTILYYFLLCIILKALKIIHSNNCSTKIIEVPLSSVLCIVKRRKKEEEERRRKENTICISNSIELNIPDSAGFSHPEQVTLTKLWEIH